MSTLAHASDARLIIHHASGLTVHTSQDRETLDPESSFSPYLESSSEAISPNLGHWLKGSSSLKSVRECGSYGKRCHSALCAPCSRRRARHHRQELHEALNVSPARYMLLWTSTVASSPDRALSQTWDDLDKVIRAHSAGSWLTRRANGYARAIEVERTPGGWHPHAHTLLVFQNAMTRADAVSLAVDIRARWLSIAHDQGIEADKTGQHVFAVPLAKVGQIVGYVGKSHLLTRPSAKPGTVTPAMLLRDAATGDAEAVRLWQELESAACGRRTWQTGGLFRPSIFKK